MLVLTHTHPRKNIHTQNKNKKNKINLMKIPFSYYGNQLKEFRVGGKRRLSENEKHQNKISKIIEDQMPLSALSI